MARQLSQSTPGMTAAPAAIQASDFPCRIFGNSGGNGTIRVREKFFGLRESFEYVRCASSRCLQLNEEIVEFGWFYPPGFYAHSELNRAAVGGLSRRLRTWRSMALLGRFGGGVAKLAKKRPFPPFFKWLVDSKLSLSS